MLGDEQISKDKPMSNWLGVKHRPWAQKPPTVLGIFHHFSKGLQDWRLRIGSHGVDAKQSPYAAPRAFVGATVRGKSYHLAGKY